jgi:guanosine-3',5'-bis(diphosphate) 3'-pyrophosphohydrolase
MARSNPNLPRMQNQARTRAPLELAGAVQASDPVEKPRRPAKPPMMRQYELVERVRRYNPDCSTAPTSMP